MKLLDFLDQGPLDQPTPSPQSLAYRYEVTLDDVFDQLAYGTMIEMEHTTSVTAAMEIALDHLNERFDYYERLAQAEQPDTGGEPEGELDEKYRLGEPGRKRKKIYPGQSSATLANYVARKWGGEVGCGRASQIVNDPNVNMNIKKRAIWYRSLHCKGRKQVREEPSSMTDQVQR
jgi:hypothetical protein